MIAHRGYSDIYVDNTEEAFFAAVENSSVGIETDVKITADKKHILSYNTDFEVLYGSRTIISETNFNELFSKSLINLYNSNKVFFTLQRYLKICRDNHLVCFIEFKASLPMSLLLRHLIL